MSFSQVPSGSNVPDNINVIIEIPSFAPPIKYEISKKDNLVWVDRLQSSTLSYPANYGYINNTLADDGDPADVLVVTPHPLLIGSVIKARPIAILFMEDDGGIDSKVVAVPTNKLTPIYKNVSKIEDLPLLKEQIEHFFKNYKELEPGKWVKIKKWGDVEDAKKEILYGVKKYESIA